MKNHKIKSNSNGKGKHFHPTTDMLESFKKAAIQTNFFEKAMVWVNSSRIVCFGGLFGGSTEMKRVKQSELEETW